MSKNISFLIARKSCYDEKRGFLAKPPRCGDLEILKWLRQAERTFFPSHVASAAASSGHIEVLRWLLTESERPPPDEGERSPSYMSASEAAAAAAAAAAAGAGRIEVLEWLLQNNFDSWWEQDVCKVAALHGKLVVLQWFRQKRNERTATSAAVEGEHLAVLQYSTIEEENYPFHASTCAAAAQGGHLEVLQWLRRELNCPWDKNTCIDAARHGHIVDLYNNIFQSIPSNSNSLTNARLSIAIVKPQIDYKYSHPSNYCIVGNLNTSSNFAIVSSPVKRV